MIADRTTRLLKRRLYYQKNKDRIRQQNWYQNRDRKKELVRRRDKIKIYRKQYYQKHKDEIKAKSKQWYLDNQSCIIQRRKSGKAKRNAWERNRRRTNLHYRIKMNLRCKLWIALKQQDASKHSSVTNLIGCSLESFKMYIESLFEAGMTWGNYGEWELDHIIPCALFDLTKPEHQKRCFHFSNYQPLWEKDNQYKHTKLDYTRRCSRCL